MTRKDIIWQIKKYGKEFVGRKQYLRYLQGETITRQEAINAFCYDCMGYYHDGRQDCNNKNCPLYPYNFYGSDDSQARKRSLSAEAKKKSLKNLDKARKAKNREVTLV